MPEPVPGKPFLDAFQKCNLVIKECMLIFHGFAGKGKTFIIRYPCVIFTMFVEAGDLAPVHDSIFVGLPVEHVRVDPAYDKPLVVDPAPAVFKEPARSPGIISYFKGITGNIERAVLVAELGIRGRFDRLWIDRPDRGYIPVKQEDMAVEYAGTALRTGCAPEPDFLNHAGETVYGIFKKGIFFRIECSDAVGNRDKGNDDHR
jgi:hypothetical protein